MSQGLCPSCGAAVDLTVGQNEISCTYCGALVKRPEAEVQFAEVKNSKLLIAETAQEGGSYEEALNYYNKVIEEQPDNADAWLNKGICAVCTSKIGDLKIPEAISSWKAAIKFAKQPDAMKKRVAKEIAQTVSDFYPVLEGHYQEFKEVHGTLLEHYDRFLILVSALSVAQEMDPHNALVADTAVTLCKDWSKKFENALSFGDSKKYTEKLDSLAEGFLKVLQDKNPQAFEGINAKIKFNELNQASKKLVVGFWVCRILGPLGFLGGIGMLWDAIMGKQGPDDPGVGGSIVTLLLCAGMTASWFVSPREIAEKRLNDKRDGLH